MDMPPPMRPVDHVEEPPPPSHRFWFQGQGWTSNILPGLFAMLLLASGIVATFTDDNWLNTLVSGTVIILVILGANEMLKRITRR